MDNYTTGLRYLRADAFPYRFTNHEKRQCTGNEWRRKTLEPFTPPPWVEKPSKPEL
jgi:hypothetical protein